MYSYNRHVLKCIMTQNNRHYHSKLTPFSGEALDLFHVLRNVGKFRPACIVSVGSGHFDLSTAVHR